LKIAAECLSVFETGRLARLSRVRWFAMLELTAYSDESATQDRSPRTFCIAGYVATADVWMEIEAAWATALREEGLAEFHAGPLLTGKSGRSKPEGERIWLRFRQIMAEARLCGFGCVVDLDAFASFQAVWADRTAHAYHDPYYLAFQHQLERMANAVPAELPGDERIVFVFDYRSTRTEANVNAILDGLRRSEKLTFSRRLGGLWFNGSEAHAGLQAADMLAYELRRHFWEVVFAEQPGATRWQFDALHPMDVRYFDREALAKL